MARQCIRSWVFLAAALILGGCRERTAPAVATGPLSAAAGPLADKAQLVTVVSNGWDRFQATMRRYERTPGRDRTALGAWTSVGPPVAVVLGREGYGWGRGLHGAGAPEGRPGPIKQEGDGRSPAGVFGIGPAYGYAEARNGVALPYRQSTPDLRCVDDPDSRHYNRIVSTNDSDVDWKSAEHMRRDDDLYVLTVVVDHNTDPPQPRAGSCIFLHLWEGPDQGMSGCTAMSMDVLEALVDWFEPGAAGLVALPRSEYDALRGPWQLPPI